jgi:hypothetical protein
MKIIKIIKREREEEEGEGREGEREGGKEGRKERRKEGRKEKPRWAQWLLGSQRLGGSWFKATGQGKMFSSPHLEQ